MASNDGILNSTESCKNGEDEIDKVDIKKQDIISGEEMVGGMHEFSDVYQISTPANVTVFPSVIIGGISNDTPMDLMDDGDVKQEQVDSAWTPTRLVQENLSEEELRTQELDKKLRGILNKLTPQNIDMLVTKVLELEIDSQKRMECLVELLFEKALAKPNLSETYAKMCLKLSTLRVPSDTDSDKVVSFRGLIISKCQTEFESGQLIKLASAETAEPAKKKELQTIINKDKKEIRLRAVAIIRFIGEFYKLKMLTDKIINYCIRHLIDLLDETNIVCLCELLTTIGKKAENEDGNQLDSVFRKMQEIVKSKSNKISGQVKAMIQDVINLRKRKWLVCVVDFQPKRIQQREAYRQQRHIEGMPTAKKENTTIQPCSSKESLNSKKVKDMCVRLVTTHGRPFALIQDAAFQEIVNIAVPSNARSKEINSNIIKGMIPEKAYQIRSKIKADVINKMVSLKLDSATYVDRHFLGINLQYIEKGKLTIRNLALLEVMERPTWELMKEKLLEVLSDFAIDSSQIYSITTDNDSNFKIMTKFNIQNCFETQDVYDIDEESICDENEPSVDEAHIDYTKEELNLENIANALSNGEFKPRAIFCVAHYLHLAVKDAIDHNVSVQMTINTARQAVMVLRRPNWKNLLKSSNLKNPIIDCPCPTRWTSTYQMLVGLHSFKGIFGEHRALSIYSEEFWAEIVDIITCLKPLNEATVAVEREQLTISGFYVEWLNCRTKVEAIGTKFAGDLVQFMKEKERDFLGKDCVLESLYLDGRINIMLTDQECVKAKSLLCQSYRQLEKIASSEAGPSGMITPSTSHDDENDMHNISDLERMLQQTENIRRLPQSFMESEFEKSLNKLRLAPRLPLSKNIISHCHNIDASDTSLQKVASCVLAAPASHVSVKRLFSSVKFILISPRTDIGGGLLQDILFIRANHDLLE